MALHFNCSPLELDREQVLDYLHHLKRRHRTPSESFFKHTVYGLRYLYRIYDLPEHRVALPSIERPKKLPEEQLEEYNSLLEEQAFPFEEEAIELHETNAARTVEGIYDEWVRKSFAALVELSPGRYAKAEIGETLVEAIR